MFRKMGFVLLLCVAVLSGGFALEGIGEIVEFDGEIEIIRDGGDVILEGWDVDFGTVIENFDLISTGPDGYLTIETYSNTGVKAEVKVGPDTTYTVEFNELGGDTSGGFDLLAGSIGLVVDKLTGNNQLNINTQYAVMGVRGTTFTVDLGPMGSILVVCSTGEVACQDTEISVPPVSAKPSRGNKAVPVSKVPGEKIVADNPVMLSSIEEFRQNWNDMRSDAFKGNALRAIQNFAKRYEDLADRFNAGYSELTNLAEVRKWKREDKSGEFGTTMEVLREKKEVFSVLAGLRQTLFLFEKVYYRVLELEGYHKEGYGRGNVRRGYSTADFFARVNGEKRSLAGKFAQVKYVMKLYSKRNDGTIPFDAFTNDQIDSDTLNMDDDPDFDSGFGDDDFFNETDDFWQ